MTTANKVIALIKGGLGNQLFGYAAARRLAVVNDAELVIDTRSGFENDIEYNRHYSLDHFSISARHATNRERLEPLGHQRRRLLRWVSRRRPFASRKYVEQEMREFDPRLLELRFKGTRYLEGYWQSENYFKDIESTIRSELVIKPPDDAGNRQLGKEIQACNSVGVHVRQFGLSQEPGVSVLSADYYRRALEFLESKSSDLRFFVFSDNPEYALNMLPLPRERSTIVNRNKGDSAAFADLWLMAHCKHVVTANSTFSWWGGWLASANSGLVTTPAIISDGIGAWGFDGLIPDGWVRL